MHMGLNKSGTLWISQCWIQQRTYNKHTTTQTYTIYGEAY